ncbi:hypothetical protein U1Q18_010273 [Sarracenia purpurea var. burkii]
MLLEIQDGKAEHVRSACLEALASICGNMEWKSYYGFLMRCFREITLKSVKQKVLLQLIGSVLDHFHFMETHSSQVVGDSIVDLLSVVENDILGDISEQKEVEKIASKMKETRKLKSFETLKLIAQNITFRTQALKLFSPVTARLQKHLTPIVKLKLESMLNNIAAGIECNPSVNQTDLFFFLYGLIEDGITYETRNNRGSTVASASKQSGDESIRKIITSGRLIDSGSQSSHLITVFALGLLQNRMKDSKLHKKDEQLLAMLDPFVSLLTECLTSKYEDIISAALKCLAPLVRLPLPSLESQADKIKTSLLVIAQGSIDTSSPLMQSCLRLLTVLLRNTRITLSTDQLHLVIQFPLFIDLERNPSIFALLLLKAIVTRKLVVHEIYDLVSRVAELMVTSQVEPIRNKCSQILLRFTSFHSRAQSLSWYLGGKQHLWSAAAQALGLAAAALDHAVGNEKYNLKCNVLDLM